MLSLCGPCGRTLGEDTPGRTHHLQIALFLWTSIHQRIFALALETSRKLAFQSGAQSWEHSLPFRRPLLMRLNCMLEINQLLNSEIVSKDKRTLRRSSRECCMRPDSLSTQFENKASAELSPQGSLRQSCARIVLASSKFSFGKSFCKTEKSDSSAVKWLNIAGDIGRQISEICFYSANCRPRSKLTLAEVGA